MRRITITMSVLLALLLSACGADSATTVSEPSDAPTEVATEDAADSDDMTDVVEDMSEADRVMGPFAGVLGGDAELEGGCTWVDVDGERYELVAADGAPFTIDPDDGIVDADGTVIAAIGDAISVDGEIDESMLSFCQIGPILTAASITSR